MANARQENHSLRTLLVDVNSDTRVDACAVFSRGAQLSAGGVASILITDLYPSSDWAAYKNYDPVLNTQVSSRRTHGSSSGSRIETLHLMIKRRRPWPPSPS